MTLDLVPSHPLIITTVRYTEPVWEVLPPYISYTIPLQVTPLLVNLDRNFPIGTLFL